MSNLPRIRIPWVLIGTHKYLWVLTIRVYKNGNYMISASKELIRINLNSTGITCSISHFFTFPFWPLALIMEYGDNLLSGYCGRKIAP